MMKKVSAILVLFALIGLGVWLTMSESQSVVEEEVPQQDVVKDLVSLQEEEEPSLSRPSSQAPPTPKIKMAPVEQIDLAEVKSLMHTMFYDEKILFHEIDTLKTQLEKRLNTSFDLVPDKYGSKRFLTYEALYNGHRVILGGHRGAESVRFMQLELPYEEGFSDQLKEVFGSEVANLKPDFENKKSGLSFWKKGDEEMVSIWDRSRAKQESQEPTVTIMVHFQED